MPNSPKILDGLLKSKMPISECMNLLLVGDSDNITKINGMHTIFNLKRIAQMFDISKNNIPSTKMCYVYNMSM